MREPGPILLAVGPTPDLARRALAENGLVPDGGARLRMVTRFMALRGWRHGTPVVAVETRRWPVVAGWQGQALENTLMTMLGCGRLRLAQESDLEKFRKDAAR